MFWASFWVWVFFEISCDPTRRRASVCAAVNCRPLRQVQSQVPPHWELLVGQLALPVVQPLEQHWAALVPRLTSEFIDRYYTVYRYYIIIQYFYTLQIWFWSFFPPVLLGLIESSEVPYLPLDYRCQLEPHLVVVLVGPLEQLLELGLEQWAVGLQLPNSMQDGKTPKVARNHWSKTWPCWLVNDRQPTL